MNFSETIVVCDIKVGRCSQVNECMTFMNIKGQGHSLTFIQGHSVSTFSIFFSLETARPIEAKFHLEPLWDGVMKVSTNGLCHMAKMAAMSIYGKKKTFKKWNQKADNLETWDAALVTRVFVQMMTLG